MTTMKKIGKISLNGEWNLKNEASSINIPALVPGSVYEALLENNVIVDPFYGMHEHEMSWVYESDWQYETTFDVLDDILKHEKIILRFNGIDTISEIELNDNYIGTTNNMFRSYEFDVKNYIKNSGNRIKVIIHSPTRRAREEIEKYGHRLKEAPDAIPGVPFLRKAQYSFGWDWGPKLPDMGIWQPIELIGYDKIRIDSVYIIQNFTYNKDPLKIANPKDIEDINVELVNLQIQIELDTSIFLKDPNQGVNAEVNGYFANVILISPDGEEISQEVEIKNKLFFIEIDIKNPKLWWTHDLGNSHLYEIQVFIKKNNIIIDSHTHKIGIREIRLVRNEDKWGETFYFLLNGVPIFAKGANWIPIDSLIPRGKRLGLYSMNLKSAKMANMNMIRVWGGGIYEDDLFYDLCDELGLLVWQDFPFACALYPYTSKFIDNFKEEAIQNIKRLRNHASLAFWCGNNENEWLMELYLSNIFKSDSDKRRQYKKDYIGLFEKLLPELINEYDPQHDYWPSSPSNGGIFREGGKDLLKPNSPDRGDSHYWMVWHAGKQFSAYRKFNSRFMSEFGFESFPSMKTISSFCPSDQLDLFSPIMENHQKNAAGNKKILKYMKKRFIIPKKFENQVILSQITQAEAIEYGVEHWRRNRNEFHCMGSLYWQLNDCWPVASWSSIDYFIRWKALHYFGKRFYQPVFPSVKEDKESVEVWITNDLRTSCEFILNWKIMNSTGMMLKHGSFNSEILPCTSLKVGTITVSELNRDEIKRQNNVVFFELKHIQNGEKIISHGFRLFDAPKKFNLFDPELSYKFEDISLSESNAKLKIQNKKIAFYVFIDSDLVDFIASDNFFSLESNESRIITLCNIKPINHEKKLSKQEIRDSIRIRSLFELIRN